MIINVVKIITAIIEYMLSMLKPNNKSVDITLTLRYNS